MIYIALDIPLAPILEGSRYGKSRAGVLQPSSRDRVSVLPEPAIEALLSPPSATCQIPDDIGGEAPWNELSNY